MQLNHRRSGSGEPLARLCVTGRPGRAARAIPRARVLLLEGCGHVPTRDDPEQVARVILDGAATPQAVQTAQTAPA